MLGIWVARASWGLSSVRQRLVLLPRLALQPRLNKTIHSTEVYCVPLMVLCFPNWESPPLVTATQASGNNLCIRYSTSTSLVSGMTKSLYMDTTASTLIFACPPSVPSERDGSLPYVNALSLNLSSTCFSTAGFVIASAMPCLSSSLINLVNRSSSERNLDSATNLPK